MQPTRILLVDMPRMLREIIESTLDAEPDMVVVGAVADASTFEPEGREFDVVVVGATAVDQLDHYRGLLSTSPGVKVLAVSDNAREATFYELEPATRRLGEVSPIGLVEAIRAARERRLAWSDA